LMPLDYNDGRHGIPEFIAHYAECVRL
jgi:hypothetical protein